MNVTTVLHRTDIRIKAGGVELAGDLALPEHATAVVLVIDGSTSPLHSPRDAQVAESLHDAGIATLMLDLMTADELAIDEKTRQLRLDVRLLAKRLIDATDWAATEASTRGMAIGYFAGGAAAAAALMAAAARPRAVGAIVCRGGRPDMAAAAIPNVSSPTLLIVGGGDRAMIPLNEWAFHRLASPRELVLVDNATHVYESTRALEEVCRLAVHWFSRYLGRRMNDDAVPDPEC